MHAMILDVPGHPLLEKTVMKPRAGRGQLLIKVRTCGVCRTDLHVVDGELCEAKLPIIPGHEIVGFVEQVGEEVDSFQIGQRVGVPWLGHTCGICKYCLSGRENLCDNPKFTGYTIDGGYAQYAVADSRFCFALPSNFSDQEAAPLLCAGLIGYRSLRMAGDANRVGVYGFGAAAHIIAQVMLQQGREVYAFTRNVDTEAQNFARELGVTWVGASDEPSPRILDAALIFAPVGDLVPIALRSVCKGGTIVCAGIHMSDIPSFPYHILWGERKVVSVANLTRQDGLEFFELIASMHIKIHTVPYPLVDANRALEDLRGGKINGAAVLILD
jgi:propanol-preferring alcohol dehydrogenase